MARQRTRLRRVQPVNVWEKDLFTLEKIKASKFSVFASTPEQIFGKSVTWSILKGRYDPRSRGSSLLFYKRQPLFHTQRPPSKSVTRLIHLVFY